MRSNCSGESLRVDQHAHLDALLRDLVLPLQPILATEVRDVATGWIDQLADPGVEGKAAKPLAGRPHPRGTGSW
ncbi:hypothetical protein ACH47Z_36090 [Streptomyces sp. NPDC020192]|uniref:hypothetical protein n=1 Tax=Streptomyces sp. NPDC020192 TaxID=3365066 RepID=UPI0037A85BC2